MKKKSISIFILFIFSFLGMLFSSIIIHELTHKNDLKDAVYNGEICILNVPYSFENFFSNKYYVNGALGYYTYFIKNQTEYQRVTEYTEHRAYTFSIVMVLIYLIALIITLKPEGY